MSINSKQKGSDFMSLLEKITDALLSKNWILTVLSFVISVIISIFVPAEIYDKLPFDSKINVIIGFVAIALCVFLVLYFFVWIIGKKYRKSLIEGERARIKNEETEEAIEEWRCFFDQLSDEEYSILMFFVITKNQRPYKRWGYRMDYFKDGSIFAGGMENQIFYKTKVYEESPPYLVHFAKEKEPRMTTSKGEAEVFTLKEDFYNTLVEIIRRKGTLSHHPRKTYKLDYGNGADLPEFQSSKYQN